MTDMTSERQIEVLTMQVTDLVYQNTSLRMEIEQGKQTIEKLKLEAERLRCRNENQAQSINHLQDMNRCFRGLRQLPKDRKPAEVEHNPLLEHLAEMLQFPTNRPFVVAPGSVNRATGRMVPSKERPEMVDEVENPYPPVGELSDPGPRASVEYARTQGWHTIGRAIMPKDIPAEVEATIMAASKPGSDLNPNHGDGPAVLGRAVSFGNALASPMVMLDEDD